MLAGFLAALLGGLFLLTGSWPPAVIVESGSMMHPDENVTYGRFGTIDPGDLVLVKDVDSPAEIGTWIEGSRERYGSPGDVVIYFPAGNRANTPIIHRAMAYVEVLDEGSRVRWGTDAPCEGGATFDDGWCVYAAGNVHLPSIPYNSSPLRSGFITKGDNPSTNRLSDPESFISRDSQGRPSPVPLEWVSGKARGELPWIGLIKLALAKQPNQDSPPAAWVRIGSAYAPLDLWVMLGVTLTIVVGVPVAMDGYRAWRKRRSPGQT